MILARAGSTRDLYRHTVSLTFAARGSRLPDQRGNPSSDHPDTIADIRGRRTVRERHRVPCPKSCSPCWWADSSQPLRRCLRIPSHDPGRTGDRHGPRLHRRGGRSRPRSSTTRRVSGWQEHFARCSAVNFLTRAEGGQLHGRRPRSPARAPSRACRSSEFFLPDLYAVVPLTAELNFGLGGFAPYGLGLRWDDPEHFSGPLHLAERGDPDARPEPRLLVQALPGARDRGRRGPTLLEGPARAQLEPGHRRPVYAARSWTWPTSSSTAA